MHLIPVSKENWFWAVGIVCLPTGMIAAVIGVLRYRRMRRSIFFVGRRSEKKSEKKAENAPL